ncbi:type VI secretion system membrane subunit TssM [Pelomonas sp. KK5]|uniref:type VI secretion system membrane subunit TssM n=1 Tax=Pelomonas sp. KK5 TaxID=1855730 RepID=UPI00097C8F21|nr:type VI secretion system membrane subunit TssM [Pelomonas sp. KK5]
MTSPLQSAGLRAFLVFLGVLLMGLAIWFIGPLLAFGELRPLASSGARVTLIAFVVVFAIFVLLEWALSVLAVAALCLLIWHAGPLLAIGSGGAPLQPLAGEWPRALLIAVILVAYLAWALYMLWHMIRHDEAFARRVLGLDRKAGQQQLAREEIRELQSKTQRALAELRQLRLTVAGRTGSLVALLRRLVEGKRHLYELPWYMIIGRPGAGKSSLVARSGLAFALPEQMQLASRTGLHGPDRGTLNCHWWFTNEAVLIDTAGRYTGAEGTDAAAQATGPTKDHAEWLGFLDVLRKARVRAPINGALLAVDAGTLCSEDAGQRLAHAALLRARLAELRQQLGIRFPVYVFVTKCDMLRGFNAFFAPMGSDAGSQVWGFTLPALARDGMPAEQPLRERLAEELQALQQRLEAGLGTRLQEEYELDRRQSLYLLPHELQALIPALAELLEQVFADSRFDTTQQRHMLRGVYLTSAAQPEMAHVPRADARSLVGRLLDALQRQHRTEQGPPKFAYLAEGGQRSFFIGDAMRKVVIPEAHLVRPNLRWEARFRLLRLLGHALVVLVCTWLLGALLLSHDKNRAYLDEVSERTALLQQKVKAADVAQHPERIAGLLTEAHQLAQQVGLDPAQPPLAWQYGLYSPPPVVEQASLLCFHLQDRMVLPVLLRRLEYRLQQSIADGDEVAAYDTLRSYLLLHDPARFQADRTASAQLRAWVVADWQRSDAGGGGGGGGNNARPLSQSFGNSAAMLDHLQQLFSGERVVQASQTADAALIKQAREFLGNRGTSERLYERAKRTVQEAAPREFSLVGALGPQVGASFRRDSGKSMEEGVPGLFTYAGYHQLFAKRLRELVAAAVDDDAWVMGRSDSAAGAAPERLSGLVEDVRRQYLQEYARRWDAFLADVRLRNAAESDNIGFEIGLVRQLAAADSPLQRLARQAAVETTLSRPLQLQDENPGDKSVFEKAAQAVDGKSAELGRSLGLRPEQRLERSTVDDRFAALREVVTGQADTGATAAPRIGAVAGALNEYYTTLVVAQTAIESGALPPPNLDSASKIRIIAEEMPAPLHKVLLDVSSMGSGKIARGAQGILRGQARAQLDRLQGLLAMMVAEPCRRQIAGRYPFAAGASEEVAADDFNAFFAAGGTAETYFSKYLQPLVDTSARPWRYKSPESANTLGGTEGLAEGKPLMPAQTGPTLLGELLQMLAAQGPSPEAFGQIQDIRQAYLRDGAFKRLGWKQSLRVERLDPTITELVLDFDGQVLRYAHGPVQDWSSSWPGPRGGLGLDVSVQPRLRPETAQLQLRGPWAPLRLLEHATMLPGSSSGRLGLELDFDGRKVLLDLSTSGINPLAATLLRNFKCPGA